MWLGNCWIFTNLTYFKYFHDVLNRNTHYYFSWLSFAQEKERCHIVICWKLHRVQLLCRNVLYIYIARKTHPRFSAFSLSGEKRERNWGRRKWWDRATVRDFMGALLHHSRHCFGWHCGTISVLYLFGRARCVCVHTLERYVCNYVLFGWHSR